MIEVKVPKEDECGFCTEIINERLLNCDLMSGLESKIFGCDVYLIDGFIKLNVTDALGLSIMGARRLINYCPICGRKLNVIK